MNVEVDYEYEVERNNMKQVISEETNELENLQKRLSYSGEVQMGIGKKTALSTHLPKEHIE